MNEKRYTLGIDIGNSHIAGALIQNGCYVNGSFAREEISTTGSADIILDKWAEFINFFINTISGKGLDGIGIAMPGPFDYGRGISMIKGLDKYESLFALNVKEALLDRLVVHDLPVNFTNDAFCFGLGEALSGHTGNARKAIAITIGARFGACYLDKRNLVTSGDGVPEGGYLYNFPYEEAIAEHYLSEAWLIKEFNRLTGKSVKDVRVIANIGLQYLVNDFATQETQAATVVFEKFGRNLGRFMAERLKDYHAACLIIGGEIANARAFFKDVLLREIEAAIEPVQVYFADNTELSAIIGAASRLKSDVDVRFSSQRKTNQPLVSLYINDADADNGRYRSFPYESIGDGKIFSGYDALADWIITQKYVCIEGVTGLNWALINSEICKAVRDKGVQVFWYDSSAFLKSSSSIDKHVFPFTGGADSVWGKKTALKMQEFFHPAFTRWYPNAPIGTVVIVGGCGAALCPMDLPVIYIELPKNEQQYRMKAGSAHNLGSTGVSSYKRSYFVDWPTLSLHRRKIQERIKILLDGQHEHKPNWAYFGDIKEGMQEMSANIIRTRPWFESGAESVQWMKPRIPGIVQNEVNYTRSHELIAIENGLLFESDKRLLEISFEWLMELHALDLLGVDATSFGTEFPIRFDILDTFAGDNLPIQCHPSVDYIREQFGENMTQDETYYILDCTDGASVYLGFTESADVAIFKSELEESELICKEVAIEQFIQKLPAKKHDLFLIPNQTVHGAGKGNLVLEISAAPYIYAFNMYDWNRSDSNGMKQSININYAFKNLDFSRRGEIVEMELISRPVPIEQSDRMRLEYLPTHSAHFYAIERIMLPARIGHVILPTDGKCHVLMVVEGQHAHLHTRGGKHMEMYYAETFIVPAAAKLFELTNTTQNVVMIIKAFVK